MSEYNRTGAPGGLSEKYGKETGVLAEFMDWLFDIDGFSQDNAYNYYMTVRSLAKFLVHRRAGMVCDVEEVLLTSVSAEEMAAISQDEWYDYLDYHEFRRKCKRGSLSVRISACAKFYKWLETAYGRPAPEYVQNTVRPDVRKADFHKVTEKEENRICETLVSSENAERNVCIVHIFCRCGLGLQEICDLNLEDVELQNIVVRTKGKDGRERVRCVPIDETVSQAIDEYLAVRLTPTDGSNAFFVSADKGRLHRSSVEKMLRVALKRAGTDAAHVTIRDLQLTAKHRHALSMEFLSALDASVVDTKRYFRRIYFPSLREEGEIKSA